MPGRPTAVASLDPTSRPSDSDAARAATGDQAAFERLYRTHVGRVFSLCARMVVDRARAEELTQDVFVRAWEKLHLFRGESAFSTWLHKLTVNVVLNERRTRTRQRARFAEEDEPHTMDSYAEDPARGALAGELLDLEQAITRLPPGARRVFTLHDVEGYKHEEIARMLGVTTGATKAQLHRARLLLRKDLNR